MTIKMCGYRCLTVIVPLAACLAAAAPPDNETPPTPPTNAKTDTVEKSVVKIFATVRYPDHFKPWNKLAASELVGSGVVIEGKRILSNAHVVLYATQVQIEANEAGDKFAAKVVGMSPEMDLVVLKLDDESFFDTHPPLARARQLPDVTDAVMAYGFPTGGFSMSITKGIVSRIEFARYNYGASGLRIQVDAAINPGNSGGPAVVGDKMIGLAFAHLSKAENISYIIPCEEIELFLKNMVNGSYHGRPLLYIRTEALQNTALRSFLKVDRSVHGLAVQAVAFPAHNPLKKWDIITRIGNEAIDDEGMIKPEGCPRVAYNYLIEQTVTNGKVPLTVLRSGETLHLQVPVTNNPQTVVPFLKGTYPPYFVYGPLAFSEATQDILSDFIKGKTASTWTARLLGQGSSLFSRCEDFAEFDGERLVVVTSFLPHKLSRGYNDPTGQIVKSINGIAIKNLAQMVQVLRDCKDAFITIEFDGHAIFTDTLIFPRAEMLADTEDILTENSVRSQGSPELMAIWSGGKN